MLQKRQHLLKRVKNEKRLIIVNYRNKLTFGLDRGLLPVSPPGKLPTQWSDIKAVYDWERLITLDICINFLCPPINTTNYAEYGLEPKLL